MPDYNYGYDGMSEQRMREKMELGWNSGRPETVCGSGSTMRETRLLRSYLPQLARRRRIVSVADVGAGDRNWMRRVSWQAAIRYVAYDLVPQAADVVEFDATREVLPAPFDLIVCRHVLNHLSVRLAARALQNFARSASRLLLLTNCERQVAYFGEHGLELLEPLETVQDGEKGKWRIELHDLTGDFYRFSPCA